MDEFEHIGTVGDFPGFVPEPRDVLLDTFDIFDVFFFGVRVVETEISLPFMGLGNLERESHSFGMSDMEISIGFRGETGDDSSLSEGEMLFFEGFGIDARFLI